MLRRPGGMQRSLEGMQQKSEGTLQSKEILQHPVGRRWRQPAGCDSWGRGCVSLSGRSFLSAWKRTILPSMKRPLDDPETVYDPDDPDSRLLDFDDPAQPPKMPGEELKTRFEELAKRLWATREELETLYPELREADDQRAAQRILTDLTWAVENCTVIGLHQIGKALDDRM